MVKKTLIWPLEIFTGNLVDDLGFEVFILNGKSERIVWFDRAPVRDKFYAKWRFQLRIWPFLDIFRNFGKLSNIPELRIEMHPSWANRRISAWFSSLRLTDGGIFFGYIQGLIEFGEFSYGVFITFPKFIWDKDPKWDPAGWHGIKARIIKELL